MGDRNRKKKKRKERDLTSTVMRIKREKKR